MNPSDTTEETTTKTDANTSSLNALITLDEPIKRGDKSIKEITLRKPKSGELRGISLVDLLNMEYTALEKIIPRISTPLITQNEVANIDTADLLEIGSVVSSFLLKKAVKQTVYLNG